jgi:hypothetical protein
MIGVRLGERARSLQCERAAEGSGMRIGRKCGASVPTMMRTKVFVAEIAGMRQEIESAAGGAMHSNAKEFVCFLMRSSRVIAHSPFGRPVRSFLRHSCSESKRQSIGSAMWLLHCAVVHVSHWMILHHASRFFFEFGSTNRLCPAGPRCYQHDRTATPVKPVHGRIVPGSMSRNVKLWKVSHCQVLHFYNPVRRAFVRWVHVTALAVASTGSRALAAHTRRATTGRWLATRLATLMEQLM